MGKAKELVKSLQFAIVSQRIRKEMYETIIGERSKAGEMGFEEICDSIILNLRNKIQRQVEEEIKKIKSIPVEVNIQLIYLYNLSETMKNLISFINSNPDKENELVDLFFDQISVLFSKHGKEVRVDLEDDTIIIEEVEK